jgi:dTDP-4-amino-4,6-dideoxygalactose transaminase
VDADTEARVHIARLLDDGLRELSSSVQVPRRPTGFREVYQLYVVRAARRDELLAHLEARGIEARVHYPVPLHLQKAAMALGYRKGDFPECEAQAGEIVTLPCHQFVTEEQAKHMVDTIREFYHR